MDATQHAIWALLPQDATMLARSMLAMLRHSDRLSVSPYVAVEFLWPTLYFLAHDVLLLSKIVVLVNLTTYNSTTVLHLIAFSSFSSFLPSCTNIGVE